MMLASPLHGELEDIEAWDIAELNCLIHAMVGTFFDSELDLQANIKKIRDSYARLGEPSAANLTKAQALVNMYNTSVPKFEIGVVDRETIRAVFPFAAGFDKREIESEAREAAVRLGLKTQK